MYAMNKELNQYRQAGALAEAGIANPHRLIQMLFEGALDRIAVARGAMIRQNVQLKGQQISKAIAIIESLRMMLDPDKGQELAANLSMLYAYMARRLLEGNARNDPDALDEVTKLLKEIKSGWDEIPESMRYR